MSTDKYITAQNGQTKRCLFAHRFANPDFFSNPADPVALVDNMTEILDHACAMAKSLYGGAALVDAELEPQDIKDAAWALSLQIQDARAVLDTWYTAQTSGGPGHVRK